MQEYWVWEGRHLIAFSSSVHSCGELRNYVAPCLQIDWDNMIYPTTVMLAMLTDNPQFHSEAQAYLQKWLCR